jgi:hypothetical protein
MFEIFIDSVLVVGILIMVLLGILLVKGIVLCFTPDNRTEEQKQQDAADLAYRMKKLEEQDQVG